MGTEIKTWQIVGGKLTPVQTALKSADASRSLWKSLGVTPC